MRRLAVLACALGLAGAAALGGCGSMSAVYGASADGGPGSTDGGPAGFDGGTADGGVLTATDLVFALVGPTCAPDGGAGFELLLTPKHVACGAKAQAKGMDHVVLDLWRFPLGPETVRFGPGLPADGQGIWCSFRTGHLACDTAVSGQIVLTDWPGTGTQGPAGHYLLTFRDGTSLAGDFAAAWCMTPAPCH